MATMPQMTPKFLQPYKSLLSENIVADGEDIGEVGAGLERVSKIKDIQDNINEKYEKDAQRGSQIPKKSSDNEGGE